MQRTCFRLGLAWPHANAPAAIYYGSSVKVVQYEDAVYVHEGSIQHWMGCCTAANSTCVQTSTTAGMLHHMPANPTI